MILYFSGTGNSEYIAKLIAKEIGDDALDAAKLIKNGESPEFNSEKPYIFVSPVYAWRLPRIFQNWISKCHFKGSKKAYFILSCGDSIGAAGSYIEKFSKEAGFEYMGTAEVVMPENYIVMFSAPKKEDEKAIISAGANKTKELCKQILSNKPFSKLKITFIGQLCSTVVTPMFYKFYIGAKKFYATDACISCGICAAECMMNNISCKDARPVWGKACTHCMACISKCPVEAIEYGKHTRGLRRYVFPKELQNQENNKDVK